MGVLMLDVGTGRVLHAADTCLLTADSPKQTLQLRQQEAEEL
ncbi:hypothetical protein [Microbacterium sp. ZW T5_56]